MKSELSKKNDYWIPKHRYYELKHFCYQKDSWEKAIKCIDGMSEMPKDILEKVQSFEHGDPTYQAAATRAYYKQRLDMLDMALYMTTSEPALIEDLKAVIFDPGMSYDKRSALHIMTCGRTTFYKLYRKFFWCLSQLRE